MIHVGDINIDGIYDGSVSAADIIGQTLYAVTTVPKYNGAGGQIGSFAGGATIGQVYSYIQGLDGSGNIWWQIAPNVDDVSTWFYVPMVQGTLTASNLGYIQAQANLAQQANLAASQAAVTAAGTNWQTLVQTYLPWVIGGIIGVALIGTVLKNKK